MKLEQAEQRTEAAESIEVAKMNAEQQLAATLAALECSNSRLTELEALVTSRDKEVAELVHVCAENSELEEKLRSISSRLAETLDCNEKLNEECLHLKEMERSSSSSVEKTVAELQEHLDATKQQLSVVEDEKRSIVSQLEQVQQSLNDSVEKYSSVTEAHASLQSDFDSMKEAFKQLKQDNLCSSDHTAAMVEECAVLKNTVENLTIQLNAADAEKKNVHEEMAELQKSLNDSVEKSEKLQERENILCRGVIELNCAMFASPIDDTSLMSFTDCDVQNLFSKIISEVAGLQKKIELQVKQMEEENQLREKVENENAVLLQESDAVRASIQSLQEENRQLSLIVSQLESTQNELSERCSAYESQVVQLQAELEATLTSAEVAEQVDNTGVCPDLHKLVEEKDAEIERLHQEIRAYKLDIERLEHERELGTVSQQSLQASASCPCESGNVESDSYGFDDNVRVWPQVLETDNDENNVGSAVSDNQASGIVLNEGRDADTDEILEMKEKMAEWEAMMLMLQTEKDEIQLELRNLEQQERQIFGTIDELLQCILNTMKGRDLFPLSSEAIVGDGSNGELWSKLALLKTVVDELLFETDEMKEKIHHMTDEVKVLEQRVSVLEDERKSLKEEAEEKSLQLQSLQESEDVLKKRELELSLEVEQLKCSASEIARHINDKDSLIDKLQILSSDADKLSAEIVLLHKEVASKDQLLNDAKASEETLQKTLNETKEQLQYSKQHLSSVECKYTAEIAELQAERDQLSARISELQKDIDVKQQECADVTDDLQRKYDDKCSEADQLHNNIASYCGQIEELQEQLKVQVSEKDELKTDHAKLAGALKELELHLDQLSAETNNLSATKVTLEQKLTSLQEESEQKIKLSESQISQLEDSLSAIQADYKATCEQNLAAENELVDCTRKLELTNTRLLQAEDLYSQQAAELLQVRSELEQLKEECRMQNVQSASCSSTESVQNSSSSVNVETTVDSSTLQARVLCICVIHCCRC